MRLSDYLIISLLTSQVTNIPSRYSKVGTGRSDNVILSGPNTRLTSKYKIKVSRSLIMNLHRTRKIPHTASVFAIYIRAVSSEQKYPEEMGYYFIFIY